jgi:5-formyltetrahydrofolate cyclo-ligase
MMTKKKLRTQLQQQRNALTPPQQAHTSQQICQHITQAKCFKNAQHIAFYTPVKGEATPLPLQQNTEKSYYLPALSTQKKHHLVFVKINPKTRYKNNQYAIPEPLYTAKDTRPAEALDLVIMPLVAVDRTGNRMGMGGGYYDRSFAFKQKQETTTPLLLGFAYDFQLISKLSAEPWDIPLDYIATNSKFHTSR